MDALAAESVVFAHASMRVMRARAALSNIIISLAPPRSAFHLQCQCLPHNARPVLKSSSQAVERGHDGGLDTRLEALGD